MYWEGRNGVASTWKSLQTYHSIKYNRKKKPLLYKSYKLYPWTSTKDSCCLRISMKIKFFFAADQEANSMPVYVQGWTVK